MTDRNADPPSRSVQLYGNGQTYRFVTRCLPRPLAANQASPRDDDVVWIIGQNPHADALAEQWRGFANSVTQFSCDQGLDHLISRIRLACQLRPATHLVLANAAETTFGHNWDHQLERCALSAFRAVQVWLTEGQRVAANSRSTLSAMTVLGGDLGIGGRNPITVGGAIAGLVKSACAASPTNLRAKIVDFAHHEPTQLCAKLFLAEVTSDDDEIEVAYLRGIRRISRLIHADIRSSHRAAPPDLSNWVVTGGARGLGPRIVKELAKKFSVRFHALGTTDPGACDPRWLTLTSDQFKALKLEVVRNARAADQSPESVWARIANAVEVNRNLSDFADANIPCEYYHCDITDRAQLDQTLSKIRDQHGPISGVLHLAGCEPISNLLKTTDESVARSISVKIQGAMYLRELTDPDPLNVFLAFGNNRGHFGSGFQVETCIANEWLAKLFNRFAVERPDTLVRCVQWPLWDEIGSSVQPDRKHVFRRHPLVWMPVEDGVKHLIDELSHQTENGNVVILDYPGPQTVQGRLLPEPEEWCLQHARQKAIVQSPLIEQVYRWNSESIAARAWFRPQEDPFLTDHVYEGAPILPAVSILELCYEAARLLEPQRCVNAIHNLQLHAGFRMPGSHHYAAELVVTPHAQQLTCQLFGEFYKDSNLIDPSRLYTTCRLELGDGATDAAFERSPLPSPDDDDVSRRMTVDYLRQRQDDQSIGTTVQYGPRLRCIHDFRIGDNWIEAWVTAPDPADIGGPHRSGEWMVPLAVLDAMLVTPDLFGRIKWNTRQLPAAAKCIRGFQQILLGHRYRIRTEILEKQQRQLRAEMKIIAEDGTLVLLGQDLTYAIISSGTDQQRSSPRQPAAAGI